MRRSTVYLFMSIGVFAYILSPRCIFFLSGKVTTKTETLIVTLLATFVIYFLCLMLRKK